MILAFLFFYICCVVECTREIPSRQSLGRWPINSVLLDVLMYEVYQMNSLKTIAADAVDGFGAMYLHCERVRIRASGLGLEGGPGIEFSS